MEQIYDYNSGRLYGKYRDIVLFDLDIRKPITQVYGKSGTGKTLLVNFIKSEIKNKKYNNDNADINISVFDTDNADILTTTKLCSLKHHLIIIDRCDLILQSEKIINYIMTDKNNHYLLFSRVALPLGLSPNYYGEFEENGGVLSINYRFNERSWF